MCTVNHLLMGHYAKSEVIEAHACMVFTKSVMRDGLIAGSRVKTTTTA